MNKKMKIFIGVLIVTVAAFITVMATKKSPEKPDQQILTADKPDAELVDASNKPVDFSAFKGKVVFVNNWASWCPPCIAEMPSIAALKAKLKGEAVVFVMVSFDDDHEKSRAFVRKRDFDFDIYFPGDRYPYATSSIPATFILDKSGAVISEHVGMADYSSDELAEQLKSLANE